jgi:hypothetical protein
MPRNLILATIGDSSVHHEWRCGAAPLDFDLFLVYYGPRPDGGRSDATYYLARKGLKWELIEHVARQWAETLARYDYIWCPDDDIVLDAAGIHAMFGLAHRFGLQLAQPSIARGDTPLAAVRQKPGCLLRYSPFVEAMCPLFHRDAFYKVAHTFLHSQSAWGIDLVWPKYVDPRRIAILDKVGVHHSRPLGSGEAYQRFRERGIDPRQELRSVVARHGGIDWRTFRRFRRGRLRMPTVPDPDAPRRGPIAWWRSLLRRAA